MHAQVLTLRHLHRLLHRLPPGGTPFTHFPRPSLPGPCPHPAQVLTLRLSGGLEYVRCMAEAAANVTTTTLSPDEIMAWLQPKVQAVFQQQQGADPAAFRWGAAGQQLTGSRKQLCIRWGAAGALQGQQLAAGS